MEARVDRRLAWAAAAWLLAAWTTSARAQQGAAESGAAAQPATQDAAAQPPTPATKPVQQSGADAARARPAAAGAAVAPAQPAQASAAPTAPAQTSAGATSTPPLDSEDGVGATNAQVESTEALERAKRKQDLRAALARVERERAGSSLLLPWLATSASAAILLAGLSVGLGYGLCGHSCSAPAWPGWFVVAGTTTGTASLVWLERKQHDRAELALRRDYLEQELLRIKWDEAAASPAGRSGARAGVRVRARF